MSESMIEIEKMSIDQLAGAFVMIAGAIGSLLLVIWQSRCHCRMNLCYIFSCERRPPSEEEMKGLKDQAKKQNEKKKGREAEGGGSKIAAEAQPEQLIPDEKSKLQRKDSMIITEEELTKDSGLPNN
tara:strand:- start:6936 stop:7316 length:381 start_codon:yes stop_codon:yes gene_type:complete